MLSHAEAEQKGAGTDAKKHAEAVREVRTAHGDAEEAWLIAEHFEANRRPRTSLQLEEAWRGGCGEE
jgi:hypothetical protein